MDDLYPLPDLVARCSGSPESEICGRFLHSCTLNQHEATTVRFR